MLTHTGVKMLQKYLAGSGKVPNFAPANETEVSPQRGQKEQTSATAEKFKKKSPKILVIQKSVVTLQNLSERASGAPVSPASRREH